MDAKSQGKKQQPSYEELAAQVADLQKQLGESRADATEAQKLAALYRSDKEEVLTGKTVKVTRCIGYEVAGYHDDGRQVLKPKWKEVEEPTYWYTIDMPPVGGTHALLNGREFYHGQTYEVTIDELRTMKEICARLWSHERSIHEDNTEAFRRHYTNKVRQFFPHASPTSASGKKVLN